MLSAHHLTMRGGFSCPAVPCAALKFGALGIVDVFVAEIFPMYGMSTPNQGAYLH